MADFIQQAAATDQTPARTEFVSPETMNQVADQAAAAAPTAPPPPQGMPVGAGMGAVQENPLTAPEEQASPEEQQQYEDLFGRVMAMVNDTRESNGQPSVAQSVVELLGTKDKPAHEAVGTTAGLVMVQMTDMAKRNGKEYDPRIVQEVGMDLVIELLDIARGSGAINNLPEEDSEPFQKLVELSVLEGAKVYGEWQLRTGQAPRQQAMKEIEGQMQREADAGELDDWGMEELDPKMRQRIAQGLGPAQQGGAPPQGGMPQQGGGMPPQGGQMPQGGM